MVLVIAAVFLVNLLTTAYGPHEFAGGGQLPVISEVETQDSGQGLIGLVIQTVVGFLYDTIQPIFSPFIDALAEQSTQQQQDRQLTEIILANVGTLVAFKSGSPAAATSALRGNFGANKPADFQFLCATISARVKGADIRHDQTSGKTAR